MTTDTRRHTPAQHDDGQACLGCGQDWPCATERERRRIVDDWLASPEAERRLAEAFNSVRVPWSTKTGLPKLVHALLQRLREQEAVK